MTPMMKLVGKDFEITIIKYVKEFGGNINVGEKYGENSKDKCKLQNKNQRGLLEKRRPISKMEN